MPGRFKSVNSNMIGIVDAFSSESVRKRRLNIFKEKQSTKKVLRMFVNVQVLNER